MPGVSGSCSGSCSCASNTAILDTALERLSDRVDYDAIQLTRLKRRKLLLKDQITWLERELDPDVRA